MHPSQISGIANTRTQPTLPGAQDVEAMDNRIITLDWLYRLDGRSDPKHPQHATYTGLWVSFQNTLKDAQSDL